MTVGPSNPHGTEVTNSVSGEREQPPTKQTALTNTSKTTHTLAANRVRVGCVPCPLTSSPRRQIEIRLYYPPCGASTPTTSAYCQFADHLVGIIAALPSAGAVS